MQVVRCECWTSCSDPADGFPQAATKTLSIKKLPPILVFQLKRFEHKSDNVTARKVDDKVRFPTTLNMLPYTATGMSAAEKENPRGPSPS
jgi:ubiquitin carboxyl-terminal hydrolase 22/27/51